MEAKDMDSDYKNSVVTIECLTDSNGTTERFYGRLEETWELNYAGMHNAMMFRVRWAEAVVTENKYFTTMSIPDAKSATVNVNFITKTEPWIDAKNVRQCFYITDQTNPSCVVVKRGKRNIVRMDGVTNDEDYDQYGNPMREDDNDNEAYVKIRINTTLTKKDRTSWCWKRKINITNKKGKNLNVKHLRRS